LALSVLDKPAAVRSRALVTATPVPESRDDAAHQSLDWLGGAVGS